MRISGAGGHTLKGAGSGAVGIINESKEVRLIWKIVKAKLEKLGYEIIDCTIESASSQTQYLNLAIAKANSKKCEFAIHIHMNASKNHDGEGVECWVYPNSPKATELAKKICENISKDLKLDNRGVKVSSSFAWLRDTNAQAIIVETLFCDNSNDVSKYNPTKVADAIVKAIAGRLPEDNINNNTDTYTVKITTDVLNVRSGPGTNYKVVTQVRKNEIYTIVETQNNWGKLKSGSGWISLAYTNKAKANTITVGSKVQIVGSKYATGQNIPKWAKYTTYTVSRVDKDKALIKEITSWVYIKDLKIV